jgi:hypothetical protein
MSHMPPLLNDRPAPVRVILAVAVPTLFGVLAGVMLGVSEAVYVLFALLGLAGGYLAGLEHDGARAGLLRGILGGSLFGLWILIAHGLFFDTAPKAYIPDPAIIHVAITTAFGALFGALGGRRRAKHQRKTQAQQHTITTTTPRETATAAA